MPLSSLTSPSLRASLLSSLNLDLYPTPQGQARLWFKGWSNMMDISHTLLLRDDKASYLGLKGTTQLHTWREVAPVHFVVHSLDMNIYILRGGDNVNNRDRPGLGRIQEIINSAAQDTLSYELPIFTLPYVDICFVSVSLFNFQLNCYYFLINKIELKQAL